MVLEGLSRQKSKRSDTHIPENIILRTGGSAYFGGIGASGLLPVTINKDWPSCYGIITPGNLRLQYGFPESAGCHRKY